MNYLNLDGYKQTYSEEEGYIKVMIQGIYGNRNITYIKDNQINDLILGIISTKETEKELLREVIDIEDNRTFINIPDSDLVILYNKYAEADRIQYNEKIKDKYEAKPLCIIPELGIKIYSKCLACRKDENGNLCSITDDDIEVLVNYLAK